MIRALFLLLLLSFPLAARAQSAPAANPVSPQQATQLLQVLRDPQQRDHFIQTLEAMTKALPAPAAPSVPIPLAPNSLGAQVLTALSGWSQRAAIEFSNTTHTIGDLPLLFGWLQHLATSPQARGRVLDADWKLLLVIAAAAVTEFGLRRVLRRPVAAILAYGASGGTDPETEETPELRDVAAPSRHRARLNAAWALMRQLPLMVLHLGLDLLPVAGFVLVANAVLGTGIGAQPTERLLIEQGIDAYAIWRVIVALADFLVLPGSPRLRLLRIGDFGAGFIHRWVWRIAGVVVFGVAFAQGAVVQGLNRAAQDDLIKLVMLVAHLMLVVVVLQCRQPVAAHIRPRRGRTGLWAALLNRLARVWHWVAIFYIVALWVVWAVELRNGFARLMHFFVISVVVLVGARLLAIVTLGALYRGLHIGPDTAVRYPGLQARAERYFPAVRGGVTAVFVALTMLALLQAWGFGALGWFVQGGIGGRLLSALGTIVVTLLLAVVVWEAANAALDGHVARLGAEGQFGRVARLRTLMPILQTTLLGAILVIIGLTILSEIGVNIAPLLAGAGIVGVAIGFGSQKLVQDLITGLFLLLENAMQVGDTVTVAGLSGVVEHLSIRTIRLRAGDGSIHIIPFSSVTSVNNTNRGIGNAAVSVMIAADEDPDRVGEVLKAIAAEMRAGAPYQAMMTGDLDLWGVDKVDGATMTLAGQIACTDSGRWGVQREFNRRMHARFRALGIRMALPAQAVVLQDYPPAAAPEGPAADAVPPEASATTATESPPSSALGHDS